MKAAVCRAFGEDLSIEEVDLAPPRDGEVRVRITACAICHSDILSLDGAWGGAVPAIFGHEAAGIVEAVGDQVHALKPGDHVVVTLVRWCGDCFYCARGELTQCEHEFSLAGNSPFRTADGETVIQGLYTGAFAEAVVVDQSQAVAIGKDISPASASLLGCAVLTGYGAVVNTAQVSAGATVAVIGIGGVGLAALQGARIAGASRVIALDVTDAKVISAQDFGATEGINAAAPDLADRVRALTGGRGVDFAFVTVGSGAAVEQALTLIRPGGKVVVVGMPASGVTSSFEPGDLAGAGQTIVGSKMGSCQPRIDIPVLAELYAQGRLKLDEMISGRFPLERINQAIASTRSGTALRNVIVMDPGP